MFSHAFDGVPKNVNADITKINIIFTNTKAFKQKIFSWNWYMEIQITKTPLSMNHYGGDNVVISIFAELLNIKAYDSQGNKIRSLWNVYKK